MAARSSAASPSSSLRRSSCASARKALRVSKAGAELRRVAWLALGGLAVVAAAPFFLDIYTINILIRSLLYACVALTVDILWGYTGILTFGQSAFFGIGAYACGLAFSHLELTPETAILAFIGGLAVAAAAAALVGWLAFGYGVSAIYISVVTLVLPIVVTQILFSGGTFTGSSSGLSGFDTFDLDLETWFWIAGSGLVLLTAAAWLFVRSDAGRLLVAIRENEQRCEYLGIDTARLKTILLVVSALIAAAAGYAYAGFTDVIAPELAGFVFGTELVIWVALGGRGTLIGPVAGTILIDLTSAYLSGSLPFVWKLVIGIAFVGVIVALPQGFIPVIGAAWRRVRQRRAGAPAAIPALRSADLRPAPAAGTATAAIALHDLSRRYGSLRVLEAIDLTARSGELLSLVGPNGAGKTTLIRCIADGHERTSGRVLVQGHDILRYGPQRCVGFGLGRKFQTATVFETLTVAECLRLARTRLERPSLWRRDPVLSVPQAALQVITATGLDQQLGTAVKHLSHGMKQALELAMVLTLEPSILLLDEPTAGLTKPERSLIGGILTVLAREHGLCILLVEHDLDFVREISSRIIVLHQGRIVLDGTVEDVIGSALVRTIYAGEEHAIAGAAP
ncbi:MAG: ATP-binding cassette domain-containing protein [Alphaproteobacteria bacterium]|nr:ATP-binding cassette domain-containing protein [Alphaproteobacteria bacterium]